MNNPDNIIFFDGICNLCNYSVNLLIRMDHKKVLKYSSLQGEFAKKKLGLEFEDINKGVVFFKDGKTYVKSEAVVKILLKLGNPYKAIGKVLSLFSYRFLNVFYDFIAKNRYRLFGRTESCRVPTKKEADLFIV